MLGKNFPNTVIREPCKTNPEKLKHLTQLASITKQHNLSLITINRYILTREKECLPINKTILLYQIIHIHSISSYHTKQSVYHIHDYHISHNNTSTISNINKSPHHLQVYVGSQKKVIKSSISSIYSKISTYTCGSGCSLSNGNIYIS